MIIDDVTITVSGGKGGNGIVRFNKTKMSLGPTGGSGGRGGDVYMKGVSNLDVLRQFRFKKDLKADDGDHGKFQNNDGKDAGDLILQVPVGTIIHNIDTKKDLEITKIGQTELVAKGAGEARVIFYLGLPLIPLHCNLKRENPVSFLMYGLN